MMTEADRMSGAPMISIITIVMKTLNPRPISLGLLFLVNTDLYILIRLGEAGNNIAYPHNRGFGALMLGHMA
jgi:hypothetical protein